MFASKKIRFDESYVKSHARSYARLHTRSNARSHARSYDYRSRDHGVTIAFFFGINFNKQIIVKKAICNWVNNLLTQY